MAQGTVGDIDIKKFTIGGMNVADPKQVTLVGFNIYESILDPLGPYGEVRILDAANAKSKSKINGKEDVEIQFSATGVPGEMAGFKFKLFQNSNETDSSIQNEGSMHSKQYDFKFVSPERLNAQGNQVDKSYDDQTSNVAKDIVETFLKSKDSVDLKEQTKKERIVFGTEHPLDALRKLSNLYAGTKSKSGLFFLFKTREGSNTKYVFDSPDNMFGTSPVITLKQNATLSTSGTSETDKQNSISWFRVGNGFNAGSRSLAKPQQVTVNHATGTINRPKQEEYKPKMADSLIFDNPPSDAKSVQVRTVYQSFNEKQEVKTSDFRANRLVYLAHFSQNYADLEVPGNPKIKIGSMINIELPKKADSGNESGESEFNGKALVVAIRHKIKPAGQPNRYTMILRVVKGSFKEGGGGNG